MNDILTQYEYHNYNNFIIFFVNYFFPMNFIFILNLLIKH